MMFDLDCGMKIVPSDTYNRINVIAVETNFFTHASLDSHSPSVLRT